MSAKRPIDRLLDYLSFKGVKPSWAEKQLGISNAYIKNSEKREGNIGSDILDKIHKTFLDINLIWLITGDGEMLNDAKKHVDTPAALHHLNEPNEGYLTNTPNDKSGLKTVKGKNSAPPTAPPPTKFLAPQIVTVDNSGNENILYINIKAAAGYLQGYGDREYIETLPSFSLPGLTGKSYRSFQVEGVSMFPTLEDKEMVIGEWVERLDYVRDDRVHIIVTKTRGIVIKRILNRIEKYGYLIAKSDALDNRNLFPDIEIYPDEILEVWYAVWHGSFTFKSPTDMYKRVNNMEADLFEVLRVLRENKLLT